MRLASTSKTRLDELLVGAASVAAFKIIGAVQSTSVSRRAGGAAKTHRKGSGNLKLMAPEYQSDNLLSTTNIQEVDNSLMKKQGHFWV